MWGPYRLAGAPILMLLKYAWGAQSDCLAAGAPQTFLYSCDCFDLQEEIWICQSAQHAERTRRRLITKVLLQDRACFRHVMRIADVDRHLHHVLQAGSAFTQGEL